MKRLRDIVALVSPYKRELLSNLFWNILNAIFSLFTFLSVVPFLNVLFGVSGEEPQTRGTGMVDRANEMMESFIRSQGQSKALVWMCLGIVALALAKNLVNYFSLFSIARIRTSVSRDLREKMYRKLLRLPVSYFSGERKGDIISRMTNDLMEIEFSLVGTLEALLKSPVMIIIYLISLFLLSWKLTLFALLFLPLSGFLISRIAKSLKNAAKRGKGSLGELISVIEETLSGIRIIKVFNAEQSFSQKFDRMNDFYFRLMHRLYRREYLSSPMSEFISLVVISFLLFVGGRIVLSGELDGKMLIGYLVIFSMIIQPARALSDAFFKISKGAASLDRMREVMDAGETIADAPGASVAPAFSHDIEFRQVHFAYGDHTVLRGINLTIRKGQTVALVGPSGSGKTTLASILARFYNPTSGEVLLDGIPIQQYTIASIREMMGFVSQESILFNDSVRNNIALGTKGMQQERVEQAARIANAEEFILRLEGRYDFIVGDGGNRLSGGQKQRIAIARAVFRNPPILILDEATSALDTQSEQLVQDAIYRLMENRTSLVIAHRLSTVQKADVIVVLDGGQIVEMGSHDELLRRDALYKRLVDMQTLQG